eukprot:m.22099 g.22099  ORF g.22099 m.22099 type:complete len:263 (-) comp6687_c0_seq1:42-830(-)
MPSQMRLLALAALATAFAPLTSVAQGPDPQTLVFDDCIVFNITNITLAAKSVKIDFNITDTSYTIIPSKSACPSSPHPNETDATFSFRASTTTHNASFTMVFVGGPNAVGSGPWDAYARSWAALEDDVGWWALSELEVTDVTGVEGDFFFDYTKALEQSPFYAASGYGLTCMTDQTLTSAEQDLTVTLVDSAIQPFHVEQGDKKIEPSPGGGLDACAATHSKKQDHTMAIVIAAVTGGLVFIAFVVYVYKSRSKKGSYQTLP